MNTSRFDASVRSLSSAMAERGSRRTVVAILGLYAALLSHISLAAAKCLPVEEHCNRQGDKDDCCQGARCRHGRCRCKSPWSKCGNVCRRLGSDPDNCGKCGKVCASGCCAGGKCRAPCGDTCCVECFAEATGITKPPKPIPGTHFCCAAAAVCDSGTGDPADDLCCWPEEVCIDGECCCDGCEGTVACGGVCCPSVSCCNGACCGPGQVCARKKANKPRTCVDANRSCGDDDDCFGAETCRGGVCCSGDRVCFSSQTTPEPVCCPLGKHCDPDNKTCCGNGVTCGTTSKKVRIRP